MSLLKRKDETVDYFCGLASQRLMLISQLLASFINHLMKKNIKVAAVCLGPFLTPPASHDEQLVEVSGHQLVMKERNNTDDRTTH